MKYQILIDNEVVSSGHFAGVDEHLLNNRVEFFKSKVKDGVTVELKIWSPNR